MKYEYPHVTIEERAGVVVAYLAGVVNAGTVEQIQAQLEAHLVVEWPLMLDLSAVNFLSSAGLSMFVALQRRLAAHGTQLVLVALSDAVHNTLSWVGAEDFIPVYADIEAGLSYLSIE